LASVSLEMLVLGTGSGRSAVYDGRVSSSFVVLANGEPLCLVDLGLGVGQAAIRALGQIPRHLVITHNHSDHAGELPVVLRVEEAAGRPCHVYAEQEVAERLIRHRMAEHREAVDVAALATWHQPAAGQTEPLGRELEIVFQPGVHTERNCGFILYRAGRPLLAYTGDSEPEAAFFDWLARAPVFILDARAEARPGHASFAEVRPWLEGEGRYLLGHGLGTAEVQAWRREGWPLLLAGDRISLAAGNQSLMRAR